MYYYTTIDGRLGMKSNGSFTKDKSRWMTFGENEAQRMQADKIAPHGATHRGRFVLTDVSAPPMFRYIPDEGDMGDDKESLG